MATVLVRNGTLSVGDFFICGSVFGKVRAMHERSRRCRSGKREPSTPVEVLGLDALPEAGDDFQVVTDTAKAKQIVDFRDQKAREASLAKTSRAHPGTAAQADAGRRGQGAAYHHQDRRGRLGGSAHRDPAEALERQGQGPGDALGRRRHQRVATCCWPRRRTPSSSGSTCGRSAKPQALAEQEKVDIRLHTIIYNLTDEMKKAMTGLLAPGIQGSLQGQGGGAGDVPHHQGRRGGRLPGHRRLDHARVAKSACCATTSWCIPARSARCGDSRTTSAKSRAGMECGITLDNYADVKQGDIIEAFVTERVAAEVFV